MIASLYGDLRWAVRYATHRPVFSAAVVATLAFGIAATTVAAAFGSAILWRPLPFEDAERLVFVWEVSNDDPGTPFRVTRGRFDEWERTARSFDALALFGAAGVALDTPEGAVPVRGVRVSARFFDVLGVSPVLGRGFTPDDEVPGGNQVVVISHQFWRQRLGGRRNIVGSALRFDGLPYTVVGVMPPVALPGWPVNPATVTLEGSHREFWIPIPRTPVLESDTRSHVFGVLGRLAEGISTTQATDELTRAADPSAAEPHGGRATPFREQFVREARLPLLVLLGAALALLLVACANLAALQVSAFEGRREEISLRSAIGASAGRLASQLGAETVVLTTMAGLAGLALTRVTLAMLPERLPPGVPLLTPVALDFRVFAVSAVASLGSAAVLAGWPLYRLLRSGPAPRGQTAHARAGIFRGLVVAQVSVTIALVASAVLLVRSLWTIEAVNPGFQVSSIIAAGLGLPGAFDTPERVVSFEDRLRGSLANGPHVQGVALAYDHPLEANWIDSFAIEGTDARAAETRSQAQLRIVSPSYFDTLGIELLKGRQFADADDLTRPGVALVNESFAAVHGTPVLGRRLRSESARASWGSSVPADFEIIGVIEDERFRGLERASEPAVYLSTRQFPQTSASLLLRTSADPRATARDLRARVRAVEPDAVVDTPVSLDDVLTGQLVARRITTDVVGAFGAAALLLAGLGVYGVLTMSLASRSREIGIRLALGATPGGIAGRILAMSVGHAVPGIAAGLVLAAVAGRMLEGFLVGVGGTDASTLIGVAGGTFCCALLAALVPALRAARVNPIETLRA
jgi:predicted permease